jgi:hypothetical protein
MTTPEFKAWLFEGVDMGGEVEECLARLRTGGSIAAPGFMNPEGVVVFHSAASQLFKVLLENDERAKGNLEQFKAQNFEVVS